jgi:hypothetical protein
MAANAAEAVICCAGTKFQIFTTDIAQIFRNEGGEDDFQRSKSSCPATPDQSPYARLTDILFIKIAFNLNNACRPSSALTQTESVKRASQAREKVSGSVKGKWT